MGLNIGLKARGRPPEAALFGCPPSDLWPPPRQQCPELVSQGIRQGPRDRATLAVLLWGSVILAASGHR
jgi:hypothetical protein